MAKEINQWKELNRELAKPFSFRLSPADEARMMAEVWRVETVKRQARACAPRAKRAPIAVSMPGETRFRIGKRSNLTLGRVPAMV